MDQLNKTKCGVWCCIFLHCFWWYKSNCYTSSRNACLWLVEIASRDGHQISLVPSQHTSAFMNIQLFMYVNSVFINYSC